jgi:hypothetical protein
VYDGAVSSAGTVYFGWLVVPSATAADCSLCKVQVVAVSPTTATVAVRVNGTAETRVTMPIVLQ